MKAYQHACCMVAGFGTATAASVLVGLGAEVSSWMTLIAFVGYVALVGRELYSAYKGESS